VVIVVETETIVDQNYAEVLGDISSTCVMNSVVVVKDEEDKNMPVFKRNKNIFTAEMF
jgi:hypothetical protein